MQTCSYVGNKFSRKKFSHLAAAAAHTHTYTKKEQSKNVRILETQI